MAQSDSEKPDLQLPAGDEWQAPSPADDIQRKYTGIDRRSPIDRREAYNLNYFEEDGAERRKGRERRRQTKEPRRGWVRISDWTSAAIGRSIPTVDSPMIYRIDEGE